ncbi:MAG: hypothetical protein ACREH5_04680 [Candidatus Omnitrophota bacterium]
MIIGFVVLGLFCAAVTWIYFYLEPRTPNQNALKAYNWATVAAGLALCGVFAWRMNQRMADTTDAQWWPVIALLGSLLLFSIILLVGGILRNLVFFRSAKYRKP